MKRRFRQLPNGDLVEISIDAPVHKPEAPAIWGDLPDYESPIDGRTISGRKQRREDLIRNDCRPYEGFDVEKREADRVRAEQDRGHERKWGDYVEKTYYQLRDGMTPRGNDG